MAHGDGRYCTQWGSWALDRICFVLFSLSFWWLLDGFVHYHIYSVVIKGRRLNMSYGPWRRSILHSVGIVGVWRNAILFWWFVYYLFTKNDNSAVIKGRTNYVLYGLWRWSILNSVGIIGTWDNVFYLRTYSL